MRTIGELITEIRLTEPPRIQSLFDKKYDGSCPCFWGSKLVGGHRLYVHGTCWRVAKVGMQDLYVYGKFSERELKLIGSHIKAKLDQQEWYNEYTLITHNENQPIKRTRKAGRNRRERQ